MPEPSLRPWDLFRTLSGKKLINLLPHGYHSSRMMIETLLNGVDFSIFHAHMVHRLFLNIHSFICDKDIIEKMMLTIETWPPREWHIFAPK